VLGTLLVAVGGYVAYVLATWQTDHSATPKPALKASQDPSVIARGEYLAHSVAHCSVCHVPRAVTEQREVGGHPAMAGGYEWKMGPLGTLHSPNITPDVETGIGAWTDEELARAIRWGVGRDGKLLTFMTLTVPAMADEDLVAVISYLRSTAPVRQVSRPHEAGFLLKWLSARMGPDFRRPFVESLKYVPPAQEPSVERGEYLARGPGWCVGCHTSFDLMAMKVSGPLFAGSPEPEPDPTDPEMVFRSPNLTPDPQTGHITSWDEEHFVARFKAGRAIPGSKMPWEAYREMTEADLRSLFRFLRTLPPATLHIGPTYRKASDEA
jgi:mono/diheme cytochrome c family protein